MSATLDRVVGLVSSTGAASSVREAGEALAEGRPVDLAVVEEVGGSTLGLMIASAYEGHDPAVSVPSWIAATELGLASSEFARGVGRLANVYGGVLAKRSGVAESFSSQSARGANTSRSAHFREIESSRALPLVDTAMRPFPSTQRTALVQGLLTPDEERLGVHVNVDAVRIDVELVVRGRRALVHAHAPFESVEVEWAPGATSRDDAALGSELVVALSARFGRWAAMRFPSVDSWNIEGEWDPRTERMWVFQIRPVPTDRPRIREVLGAPDGDILHTTGFVWGAFDVSSTSGPRGLGGDEVDVVHVIDDEGARAVVGRDVDRDLARGLRVLVVDHAAGFRLSHEPTMLPRHELRDGFIYVALPSAIWNGRTRVRIRSDADRARVEEFG